MMMEIPRKPKERMGPAGSNRRPSPCKGDVIPLDHEPDNLLMSDWNVLKPSVFCNKNVGTLSTLELTFARTELESYTTARTQNIAKKSVYWIEKASDILWENTCGVISQTTMKKLHNSILSNYSSHDSWGKVLNFTRAFLKYLSRAPSRSELPELLVIPRYAEDTERSQNSYITHRHNGGYHPGDRLYIRCLS